MISDQADIHSQPTLDRGESSLKFGKDISEHSLVIGLTIFFKMAAWRAYWISDWAEIQSQPTLDRGESSLKFGKDISRCSIVIGPKLFFKMAARQPY